MTSDLELLHRFARENSQDAFAEIVRRHLNLVYSAALRQVRSPQLAEEIAQSVFADLARNAGKLKPDTILAAWLYTVTRRTAIGIIRKESRRQLREQIAIEMQTMNATANDWTQIEPLIDDAMAALDETDRTAILLRYFENKNLREVGEQLNISDDAAQKRVSRAVERLREFFSKQNVTIGASGLVVLISANAVQSAPVGLSAAILTATSGITSTLGMTMIHKILVAGFAAAALGSGIYSVHLQKQVGALQQQQTSLNQQIAQLIHERDDAKNQLAALQQENEQLRGSDSELLKLRGEVSRLRSQQNVSAPTMPTATNGSRLAERKSISVATIFVSIPAEDLQSLGVEWMSDTHGNKLGLLSAQQYKSILQAMKGASDVNLMNSPHVISLNGETAAMSVSRAVPLAGTNADVGITLQVTPFYSTNSSTFDITLNAKLRELTGDPSTPDLQTIQITNQINVTAGQIAVLEQDLPHGGWWPDSTNVSEGPKSLLMFVTPAVVNSRDFERPGPRPGTGQRVAGIWGSPTNFDDGLPKSQ